MRLLKRKTGPQEHIYSRDPALDASKPEALAAALKAYRETGDRAVLPLKDGCQPAVWQFMSLSERSYRELTRTSASELQRALATDGIRAAAVDRAAYAENSEAFRRGVVGVEGVTGEDGRPLQGELRWGADKHLTSVSLELIWEYFGQGLITEIGQRIIAACDLDPTSGRG